MEKNFILDLSDLDAERVIIVGELLGEHDRFVNLIYQQRFTYKDVLVTTGNFIDIETADSPVNDKQLENILFIKNLNNTYSVKGGNEFDFLRKLSAVEDSPEWIKNHPKSEEILKFIEELPLIIRVSPYIYVVNAGVQPGVALKDQNPEAFYSIGKYDKDSRFYQSSPEEKSWYDYNIIEDGKASSFCFGGKDLGKVEVPAGYCLGREKGQPIKALILRKGQRTPILVEG